MITKQLKELEVLQKLEFEPEQLNAVRSSMKRLMQSDPSKVYSSRKVDNKIVVVRIR